MKFLSTEDKYIFLSEMDRLDLFAQVTEEFQPPQDLKELFIKRRLGLIKGLKNFRKSQQQKSNWRGNKWKYLSGIRRFHKSTAGKKFHRSLGRFLATRLTRNESLSKTDVLEFVLGIASARTHALLEKEYYIPIADQVEYEIFLEELLPFLSKMDNFIITEGFQLDEEDEEFLLRITEATALIKSFAEKTGKPEQEIDAMWNEIKSALLKDGKSEDDPQFYGLLVSVLKKKLDL